jgi:polyphosphate kinase
MAEEPDTPTSGGLARVRHRRKAGAASSPRGSELLADARPSDRAASDGPEFVARDRSWIHFNRRVLEEANDPANPLLERVKFLAITASNLDEYIEIRLAGLLQRNEDGPSEPDYDGLLPAQSLHILKEEIHRFVADQYECWNRVLLPELEQQRIRLMQWSRLSATQRKNVQAYFQSEVDPLLTPITIDPAHPFPRVLNRALCLAVLLRPKRRRGGSSVLGVLTVPRALPRFIRLTDCTTDCALLLMQDLIARNLQSMYRGYEVLASAAFRVTRNSNLYFEEEETRSLLESVRSELHNRRKGDAVRLEIAFDAHPEILERLRVNFELEADQVFHCEGPVNLARTMFLHDEIDRPDLKFPSFTPRANPVTPTAGDLFTSLRERDILLHHPYDAYDPVVDFIRQGAADPRVVAIKQTLYRTSTDSPMFHALTEAAAHKEVTVVVELMARFDEASNIHWARSMEDAGVQVFYGVVGLKTHCKLAMLVRRDEDGVTRRYCHLGTGNYNPVTAHFYTDLSLLTANPEITERAHLVFNYLTAHADVPDYSPLLVAPHSMAARFLDLIRREAEHAAASRPARILAKMNALLDPSIIRALYDASRAGVEIDLIVRGVCTLRPGVPGLSERICVRSIVGRFLEHSRIFFFQNGHHPEVFAGSADWMPRNLYERCEVVFPVRDPALRERITTEILATCLADNVKARFMHSDGSYTPMRSPAETPFDCQNFFLRLAEGRANAEEIPKLPPIGANH